MTRTATQAWTAAMVLACAWPAHAVKTNIWRHDQAEDFEKGTFEQTVATSLGQITLARTTTVLLSENDQADYINALAQAPSGTIYAATGPNGVIYKLTDHSVDVFARAEDKNIFSLLIAKDGSLLAGTGGARGRILKIDRSGKVSVFFAPPDVHYVWAMSRGPAGEIYAATGPNGQVFVVDPAGQGKVLYRAKQKHMLCLAIDKHGTLYAGSDTEGLVYRIDPKTGKAYVLYDADEPEISAIVLDDEGNIYAATAAADLAKPGKAALQTPAGRPDRSTSTSGSSSSGGAVTTVATRAVGRPVAKPRTPPARPGPKVKTAGNAIYRIDPLGFVSEVFRQPVAILSMVEAGGTLTIGTGNEGRIYQITPATEQTIALARLTASQALALLRLRDGRLVIGTANPARIVELSAGYARKGTYISEVLDAGQIARWGRIRWRAQVGGSGKLTVETRSGNVHDPDLGTWDDWSSPIERPGAAIPSPIARYFQYRLTLSTTHASSSPVVDEVRISWQAANQPPKVTSISFASAKEKPGKPGARPPTPRPGQKPAARPPDDVWIIKWEAADPNEDRMVFDLYFRQRGQRGWILLEEDIAQMQYSWDTKTVPDGRYELRVVAKDTPDNPPAIALQDARISDEMIVDNTPPRITDVRIVKVADDRVRIHCRLVDAGTTITAAHYAVDSQDEWIALLPEDDIFDSSSESVSFELDNLTGGQHRLAIKAEDEQHNVGYLTRLITIGP